MKEIDSLVQRANKYLRSARVLLQEEDYESTVSRAYYAMFFLAEALLLTKKLSFSSHKGVLSAFGEHFIKSGTFPRELSKWLKKAFEKRQVGDYEYTFAVTREEAKEIIGEAEQFVAAVVNYLMDQKLI